MPMATFSPPLAPDQGMVVDCEPKIVSAQFGDGYAQEAGDGINNLLRKMPPRWTNLRKAEADAIINFLEPKARNREAFWWIPPGESAYRSLKCIKFTYAWKKGNFCDITAEFQEAPSVSPPPIVVVIVPVVYTLVAAPFFTSPPAMGAPALTNSNPNVKVFTAPGLIVSPPVNGAPVVTQKHILTSAGLVVGSPALGTSGVIIVGTINAPVLARTSGAGSPPITWTTTLDATVYAGYFIRLEVSTTSNFAAKTQDLIQPITPSDIAAGTITFAGFVQPTGTYFMRSRIERDDGLNSPYSNILTDTIAAVTFTHRRTEYINVGFGSGPAVPASAIPIASGDKVVVFIDCYFNGVQTITGVTANSGAITFTRIGRTGTASANEADMFYADTAGVISLNLSIALSGSTRAVHVHVVSVKGSPAGGPAASYFEKRAVTNEEHDVDGGLAVPAGGAVLSMVGALSTNPLTWLGATELGDTAATDSSGRSAIAIQSVAGNIVLAGNNSGGVGYTTLLIANSSWGL